MEAGFNINSPKQLVAKLTVLLGEEPIDSKTGKASGARSALRAYAADHQVIQTYLMWKRIEKRRQMVVALLEHQDADGFIRANYMQLGADTGRMSCVAGTTVLITSRGDFTFEEYLPQEGDLVLTHKGRWMPVKRKLYRGVEPVYEVVTAEGGMLCCTSDHKLWTGGAWVRISDLSVGDSLGLFKEVGSAAGKYRSCAIRVSKGDSSNGVQGGRDARNIISQCHKGAERSTTSRKEKGGEGSTVITWENRISESDEGQEWFPAPQLYRQRGGSERLLNRTGRKGRTSVSAPFSNCTGTGHSSLASLPGSTSYRWRYAEQQPRQLSFSDESGSHGFTPSTTVVESIKPMGTVGVWDIEVEGDHSYALYGFLSHNCSNPNLQQVPRDPEFRAAAEAPEGWTFVSAYLGQTELRLAASISGDVTMRNAFKQGEDLHTLTAKAIYAEEFESADKVQVKQMRQVAKSANFGLLYGSGAKGLREYAGAMDIIMSHEEADSIRTTFLETYDGIAKWQKHNAAEAYDSAGNRWAETRIPGSGLRRYLPGELNRLTTRCNTPVQGAGAAVLKNALAALWSHIYQASEFEVKLCAVIHDEILCLVREGEEEKWKQVLTEVMESAEALWLGDVPPLAEAAAGKTWQEAK